MAVLEADAEAILGHGGVLRAPFRWQRAGRFRLKARAPISDTYERIPLNLYGTYNTRTRAISYTLVVANCRIRSLDLGGPAHTNPDGVVVACPHKHRWTDAHRDTLAYSPSDITATDRREVLTQFLGECNVRFAGEYFDLVEQGELGIGL